MPVVTKENYHGPYELLEAMRYKKLDRWSYVQDYDDYLAQSQAIFVGHGIRIGLDGTNKTRIAQIYNNSPMYPFGVRRGWIIKKLNGTDLAPIFLAGDGAAYRDLIGPSQAGVTNTFLFVTPEGKDSIITTTKSTFTLNTVLHFDTLVLKTGVTGHLVFEQFVEFLLLLILHNFLGEFLTHNADGIQEDAQLRTSSRIPVLVRTGVDMTS